MEAGRSWRKVFDEQWLTGFWRTVATRRQRKLPIAQHTAVALPPKTGCGRCWELLVSGSIFLRWGTETGSRERQWRKCNRWIRNILSYANPESTERLQFFSSYELSLKNVWLIWRWLQNPVWHVADGGGTGSVWVWAGSLESAFLAPTTVVSDSLQPHGL